MGNYTGFECIACGRKHPASFRGYVCEACGGNLDITYDYKAAAKTLNRKALAKNADQSVQRYLPVLPVEKAESFPPVRVGMTPLYGVPKTAHKFGLGALYVKDDGRNPSCSFKDRAGCVVAAVAMERGEKVICGASTGNAASSMACMTATLPVRTIIFVPKTAPKAKIAQLLVFGAEVITVNGTYDQAFDLCIEASKKYGWYNRNTGYNPFTREGKKTCSFEICEQLGWTVPDKVFVSVGDANIISGLWKGFTDLLKLGLIDKLPQLIGVQAEGSNAVAKAFDGDGKIRPVSGDTVADSISVSVPRDGMAGVRALKETCGFPVVVSDAEILAAIPELAREASVFAEPAGAAAYAGLKKAFEKKMLEEGETAVLVVTGNGLKDVASAMKAVGEPHLIEPDMASLEKLVSEKLSK